MYNLLYYYISVLIIKGLYSKKKKDMTPFIKFSKYDNKGNVRFFYLFSYIYVVCFQL